ncbi:MFS transporter [Ferviditalea candida]|uniref:MFS transporter n=1 Tax=Ferviditalea candida TaxID=3108399 RepID=A0ABU5ZGC2_9BACL|nr:MFS transporter [Paenibacillaceae bacterium T2]
MIRSNKHYLLLITIALGTLLNPLNSSMISVALTRIQGNFHLSFSDVSWLISTFYLASAIAQPVLGKLGDFFGRKRLFLLGLSLVAAASMLAPFSPNLGTLITLRVVQAIGSAALFPSGMGIIRNVVTENQARAIGILSVFSSTAAAFGPSIGGFLIHWADWPAIFLVNFPFIIASFTLAIFVLPKDSVHEQKAANLDISGILLFSGTIISFLLFLLSLDSGFNGWDLALGIVFAFLFYINESRSRNPFIDLRALTSNSNAALVYLQFILVNVIFYSIFFGVPAYLQKAAHFNAQTTGLIMLSIAGFGVVIVPLAGRWIDRSGPKPVLITGSIITIIGTLMLQLIQDSSTAAAIFGLLSVLGLSVGFNNLGLQTALYTFVPRSETGAASGLFMTSRYFGTILSSSLLGMIFASHISASRFHLIATVCAVIGTIVLMLSVRMPNRKLAEKTG